MKHDLKLPDDPPEEVVRNVPDLGALPLCIIFAFMAIAVFVIFRQ
jgi:hypothetical protein